MRPVIVIISKLVILTFEALQGCAQAALSWIRDFWVNANVKSIMNSNFIELNEANFDREVLNAMQPVLERVNK